MITQRCQQKQCPMRYIQRLNDNGMKFLLILFYYFTSTSLSKVELMTSMMLRIAGVSFKSAALDTFFCLLIFYRVKLIDLYSA